MTPRPVDLHRKAAIIVKVGGRDVTALLEPYLISVQVTLKRWALDTCTIELDDRDGRLDIPAQETLVQVWMGWSNTGPKIDVGLPQPAGSEKQLEYEGASLGFVYQGWISSVESGFARGGGGGRRLWIESESADLSNLGKGHFYKSWGEGEVTDSDGHIKTGTTETFGPLTGTPAGANTTPAATFPSVNATFAERWNAMTAPTSTFDERWDALSDNTAAIPSGDSWSSAGTGIPLSQVWTEAAAKAGYTGIIGEKIGAVKRDFWYQDESFHAWAMRTARDVNATIKFMGGYAVMTGAGDPVGINGLTYTTIEAYWGINLLSWRIKPFIARSQFKNARNIWFDIVNGEWKETIRNIGGELPYGRVAATVQLPAMAPNRQVADQVNDNTRTDAIYNRGQGWCIINGEPRARVERPLVINGARPGVDGSYIITEAEHNYTRAGGYTTRCQLEQPDPGGDFAQAWPTRPLRGNGLPAGTTDEVAIQEFGQILKQMENK